MTIAEILKPNFIVIGAAKAGTTGLCALLNQHPSVFVCEPKEPKFFSLDENFQKGWEWYGELFQNATNATAIGEGSVNYTMRTSYPKTAERIAQYLPNAKLIYIVLHPLERIVSNWRMYALSNSNPLEFNEALRTEECRSFLIDRSKYWYQINAYTNYFAPEQLSIFFFEDFIANPQNTLQKCFNYLGVDPNFETANPEKPHNRTDDTRVVAPWRKKLRQIPLWRTTSQLIPQQLKKKITSSSLSTQPQIGKPEWDKNVYQYVVDEIAEDAATFLKQYGKPLNYWSF